MAKAKKEESLRYIEFMWEGSVYTLEFSRETADYVEHNLGINVADMLTNRRFNVTDLPKLFRAALLMHHPKMKQTTADTLYELMTDKQNLGFALIELLASTVNAVFDEPEEGKAISWTRH